MSSVIVKQKAVRKVAQAAIDWFDRNVERQVADLWAKHNRALQERAALSWWRRVFSSKPVAPDDGDFWNPSAESSARRSGSAWRDAGEELLKACSADEDEAIVDAGLWVVLTGWARAWDREQGDSVATQEAS